MNGHPRDYRLRLPESLAQVHDVFHVSTLRKCLSDPSQLSSVEATPVQEDLTYEETPVQIFYRKEKVLRNKTVPLVKVLWIGQKYEEATWEPEVQMRSSYPHLFDSEDRIP